MRLLATLLLFSVVVPPAWAQESSALERYRNLKHPAEPVETGRFFKGFEPGWRERVALEFEIVNEAKLEELRAALKDKDKFVRAKAARVLGIRGDKKSADALAEMAQNDPEYIVRTRAVESLGLLKARADVVELVKKDKHAAVSWAADLAADQCRSKVDCAAQFRKSFAQGIKPEEMGLAKVGKQAPDFMAQTLDGKDFKLSSLLGKKPIAIYFAGFDQ